MLCGEDDSTGASLRLVVHQGSLWNRLRRIGYKALSGGLRFGSWCTVTFGTVREALDKSVLAPKCYTVQLVKPEVALTRRYLVLREENGLFSVLAWRVPRKYTGCVVTMG